MHTIHPELAFHYLLEYVGFPLKNENGIFYLDEVKDLDGYDVTYKLRGIPTELKTDVNELLIDISNAYGRTM